MFKDTHAFSSFSVNDLEAARTFYGQTLGVPIDETSGGFNLHPKGGGEIFVYGKDNHVPATFTVLNFAVADIDEAAMQLQAQNITLEHYDNMPTQPDEKGIYRGGEQYGPDIAWFKDPAGNVLSIMQNN